MPGPVPASDLVVEYLKWPRTLHYRIRMAHLGEDSDGVWLGARAGGEVERASGLPLPVTMDSVSFFPRAHYWSARWYARRADSGAGPGGTPATST